MQKIVISDDVNFQLIDCYNRYKKTSIIPSVEQKSDIDMTFNSEMILYCVGNMIFTSKTEFELFCKRNSILSKELYTLEYIRYFGDKEDVIRKTDAFSNSLIYVACDIEGFLIYNEKLSMENKRNIWDYNYGTISDIYDIFRNYGVQFNHDIYLIISKRNMRTIKLCRERYQMSMGYRQYLDK